jgi:hypothetical protein
VVGADSGKGGGLIKSGAVGTGPDATPSSGGGDANSSSSSFASSAPALGSSATSAEGEAAEGDSHFDLGDRRFSRELSLVLCQGISTLVPQCGQIPLLPAWKALTWILQPLGQ